jgi:transposase-like protein
VNEAQLRRWLDLGVPWETAERQVSWELHQRVDLAHQAGATYKEIARHLGRSVIRVRQMAAKHRKTPEPPPVAATFASQQHKDLAERVVPLGKDDTVEKDAPA